VSDRGGPSRGAIDESGSVVRVARLATFRSLPRQVAAAGGRFQSDTPRDAAEAVSTELGTQPSVRALDEVVACEDVHEGNEWNYRGDRPSEFRDQAEIAAEHEIDPDQHNSDRMQDAQQKLHDFLHGDSYLSRGHHRSGAPETCAEHDKHVQRRVGLLGYSQRQSVQPSRRPGASQLVRPVSGILGGLTAATASAAARSTGTGNRRDTDWFRTSSGSTIPIAASWTKIGTTQSASD
jgi:hypothetical protein